MLPPAKVNILTKPANGEEYSINMLIFQPFLRLNQVKLPPKQKTRLLEHFNWKKEIETK